MSGRLRVAAYCRVSTDQDDQLNSMENQKRYFEEYITRQPDWQLEKIYADEGLSGTSSAGRFAFQRMLTSARAGEIDLILTKEVSRFARNTVDALAYTRELRKLGVGVIFINDNIDTRQNDGEFRLTIMASVAQEESRKTSERVKWGQKRAMENGVVFGCNNMYGFDLHDGKLTVRPYEAMIVQRIFHKFLNESKGTHIIARELYEEGVAPPKAKGKPWSSTMILRILRNEKYCGDLIQRKSFTPNYLDHHKVRNDGQEEQVCLRGHHEAIIPREMYEQVQAELARRAPKPEQRTKYSNRYWCSGKIICGCCGARFVPRKRQRAGGTSYFAWVCHSKGHFGRRHIDAQGNAVGCNMRTLNDQTIKACMAFVVAQLQLDQDGLIEEVLALLPQVANDNHEIEQLQQRQAHLLEKKDAVLDAYFENAITKEEMNRLRSKYDDEAAQLAQRLATLQQKAEDAARCAADIEQLRAFLQQNIATAETVFGELLKRFTVEKDSVSIALHGLPVIFRLTFTTSGKAMNYHTEITSCELLKE